MHTNNYNGSHVPWFKWLVKSLNFHICIFSKKSISLSVHEGPALCDRRRRIQKDGQTVAKGNTSLCTALYNVGP